MMVIIIYSTSIMRQAFHIRSSQPSVMKLTVGLITHIFKERKLRFREAQSLTPGRPGSGTTSGAPIWMCLICSSNFLLAVLGLCGCVDFSRVAAGGGCPHVWCAGFSLCQLLLLPSAGSRLVGSGVAAPGL